MQNKMYIHFNKIGNQTSINQSSENADGYVKELDVSLLDSLGNIQCYKYDVELDIVVIKVQSDIDKENEYDIVSKNISKQIENDILIKYSIIDQLNLIHDGKDSAKYKEFLAFRELKKNESKKLKQQEYKRIFNN